MRYHIELDDHHAIDLELSPWSGKEVVYYDGKIVSEQRNLNIFSPVHSFTVQETGENMVYEVQILAGFLSYGYAVRRNGIIKTHTP